MIPFKQSRHTVPEVAKQPQNIFEPPPCLTRDCVLFFEGLVSFSVNSAMMSFTKKLYFCLICPQYVLPEGLGLSHKLSNSSIAFLCVCVSSLLGLPFHSDGDEYCELTLLYPVSADQLEFVWKLSGIFIHHLNNTSL